MSFDTFIANPRAVKDFGDWWIIISITNPSGVTETLRFSRHGTRNRSTAIVVDGDTINAHEMFQKRISKIPTITHSMWKEGGILSSSSLPSYSTFSLINDDRGLDKYAPKEGYIWSGGTIKAYFFDRRNVQGTIKKMFHGQLGRPRFSLQSNVDVPVYGLDYKFNKPAHSRVYRGTSGMLELYALGANIQTINYGTPAAVNLTGDMTTEQWIWLDALPTSFITMWGWEFAVGRWPWSITLSQTLLPRFRGTTAGTTYIAAGVNAFAIQKPYHFATIVSGRDVTFVIWDDDNQTQTIETFTNLFPSGARDSYNAAGAGNIYYYRTSQGLRQWTDDNRVWNYARTIDEIVSNRHRPFKSGEIPSGLVHYTPFDEGTGTVVTDLSTTAANGAISGTGTHTWLWAMEGGPELAGTPKPDTIGKKFGMKPVLVDPIRNRYQVHFGSTQSIQSSEGGNPHAMQATASSMRAYLTAGAPAAGQALPYLARGYFTLPTAVPVLPIAAIVEGANDGSLGYVSTVSKVARYLASRRSDVVDPTDINTAGFTSFESGFNPTIGMTNYDTKYTINPDGSRTATGLLKDLLDKVLRSGYGWFGFPKGLFGSNGNPLFHIDHFKSASVTPDSIYNQSHIINIEDISQESIIYEVEIRYHYNDVVMQEDQVASTIKGTVNWTQWTKPYLSKISTDKSLKDKYEGKGGKRLILETLIYNDSDAQTLGDHVLALVKGDRPAWRVTLTSTGLGATIGETESLGYTNKNNITVLGLDGLDKYILVTTVDRIQEGIVVHDLVS